MPEFIEIGPENFPVYAKQILEIERASFISPWSGFAFKAETEKSISQLWVLISDKTVSGYICFLMVGDEIQLLNLAVHPEKKRQGLGERLLSRMIAKGVAQGVRSVWLEVRPSNMSARNLYKKLGFQEAGIRPNYYPETKEDAILMSLTLPDKKL
jgi:[ribosomal protein S18]-alanine N-acetyltransferase